MRFLKPILPQKFDENELFVIIIALLLIILLMVLPRRFPRIINIFIFLFNISLAATFDYLFAGAPFEFYDTLDKSKMELLDFLLHFIVYPLPVYLFIYGYDRWRPKKIRKWFYLAVWIGFIVLLEWISQHYFNVFQYNKGWSLKFSAIVYTFVLSLNLMAFRKVKKLYRKTIAGER